MAVPYPPQTDPTNVVGKRVGAFLIDLVIVWGVGAVMFFALAESGPSFGLGDPCSLVRESSDYGGVSNCFTIGDTVYATTNAESILLNVVSLSLGLGIFVFLQGIKGFTPGKAAVGLRLVNEQGVPPGPGKAFLKGLAGLADAAPFCIPYLVGFIVALSSKGHRRIGDMAAKTFVVSKAHEGQPVVVPGVTAVAGAYGTPVTAGGPQPGQWAQPAPAPAGAPAPAPGGTGPQWDEARKTYIQWDAARNAWLGWDDTTKEWQPL